MKINREQFDEAVKKTYDKWQRDIIRLITGDWEEATDILNDVIMSIYDRLEEGEIEVKNLSGYIYLAARYSKISKTSPYQRKRDMDKVNCPVDEAFCVLDEDDEEIDELCFADIQECLEESPFSWSEKEIFLRKNLEGKSKQKMADEIGVTRGRISYRYAKVREYLKDNLKRE